MLTLIEPFQFLLLVRQLSSHCSGSAGLAGPRCEEHFPKIKQKPAPINTPICVLAELRQRKAGNCFLDRPGSKKKALQLQRWFPQTRVALGNLTLSYSLLLLALFQSRRFAPSSHRTIRNNLYPILQVVVQQLTPAWPKAGKHWWQHPATDHGVSWLSLGGVFSSVLSVLCLHHDFGTWAFKSNPLSRLLLRLSNGIVFVWRSSLWMKWVVSLLYVSRIPANKSVYKIFIA